MCAKARFCMGLFAVVHLANPPNLLFFHFLNEEYIIFLMVRNELKKFGVHPVSNNLKFFMVIVSLANNRLYKTAWALGRLIKCRELKFFPTFYFSTCSESDIVHMVRNEKKNSASATEERFVF